MDIQLFKLNLIRIAVYQQSIKKITIWWQHKIANKTAVIPNVSDHLYFLKSNICEAPGKIPLKGF